MLIVTQRQMEALGAAMRGSFEADLKVALARRFPLHAALAGAEGLQAAARAALARAARSGLATWAGLGVFAETALLLGCEFDADPLLAEVAAPLSADGIGDEVARADHLFDLAWDWSARIHGPDGGALLKAVARLRVAAAEGAAVHDLPGWLERLWPERFAATDAAALEAFVAAVLARAAAGEEALHLGAAFLGGVGVAEDPVFNGCATERGRLPMRERIAGFGGRLDTALRELPALGRG